MPEMRTQQEVSERLDLAIKQADASAIGSEAKIRASIIVTLLAWVLGESENSVNLGDLDA